MPDSLKFQLELIDKMTKPGKEMEAQLKKLKLQLSDAEKQVKATEAELAKLGKGKVVDIAQYKNLTAQLGQQKGVVAQLRGNVLSSAQAMTEQEASAVASTEAVGALGGAAAAAGVAVAALGVAMGAAAIGGMSLALSATEAKNDTLDALEAFQGSAEAANATYASILGITDRVAISVKRGQDLARELAAAGITSGDALTGAIEAIGSVESVLGSGAGEKIQSIIEKAQAGGTFEISAKTLKGTGVSSAMIAEQLGITPKQLDVQMKAGQISAEKGTDALIKAVQGKFGALAGKQVLDFSAQMQKLKDNITGLFEDVDTGGFLTALKDLLSIFDQNTKVGAVLKEVITSTFNGLFKVVQFVKPYVEIFFLGMIHLALRIYIAFVPLIAAIKKAFGGDQTANLQSFGDVFTSLGKWIDDNLPKYVAFATQLFGALIPAFKLLGAILGPIISLFGMLMSTIMSVVYPIMGFLAELVGKVFNIGADIVNGLVNGIKSMINAPVDTIKGMATSALNAFKGVFDSHSPSKVMADLGGGLMTGLEQGIDKNSGSAQATLSESVAPPALGNGSGGSSRSVVLNVEAGAIQINATGGAQQIAADLPGLLANVFEQAMIEVGGAQAA